MAFLSQAWIASLAERIFGVPADALRVYVKPLAGGLCGVTLRVLVRFPENRERPTAAFVVKAARGHDGRELEAYRWLLGTTGRIAPKLLHAERHADTAYLCLEWINSWRRWPWDDAGRLSSVIERLAEAHATMPAAPLRGILADWNYEAALAGSAAATTEFFEACVGRRDLPSVARALPALRRLTAALPAIRREILSSPVVLHGDAHAGNVLLRLRGRRAEPVFLDWARVRLGSPMEDVSSWLKSLGFWEDTARRRHDTLLRRYFEARGLSPTLTASVRQQYWLGGACNALAGALRYHLFRAVDETAPEWLRLQSAEHVQHWARVVIRADACWRQ